MKYIFSLFRLETFHRSIVRFPIAVLALIAITGIALYLVWFKMYFIPEENMVRFILSASIVFFLSIGMRLSSEAGKWSLIFQGISQILVIIFGAFFFHTFNIEQSSSAFIYYILMLIAIMGYVFFAPHIRRLLSTTDTNKLYYPYFLNTLLAFVSALVFGIIFFLLGFIAISSVFFLFNISEYILQGKIIGTWAVLGFLFLSPLFGISRLPNREQFYELVEYKKQAWHFIIEYLLLPFSVIYFAILYAYTFKILLNFGDWPRQQVSWMVIGFSTLGYFTYILSYILENTHKYVLWFRRTLPVVIIPQIAMLFYAIYLRINQFDITINRYLVVLFGLWLLIISLYLIISKRKFLAFIPFFLTVIILAFSVGQWSIYQLPESRQLARLESQLVEANILVDGKIVSLADSNSIDPKLGQEISSQISYLCNNHSCNALRSLFPSAFVSDNGDQKNSWQIQRDIKESIEIKNPYEYKTAETERKNIMLTNQGGILLPISDYSHFLKKDTSYSEKSKKKNTFFVDVKTQKLYFYDANGDEHIADASSIFSDSHTLIQEHIATSGEMYSYQENLSFSLENATHNFLIIFDVISAQKENDIWVIRNFESDMLFVAEK